MSNSPVNKESQDQLKFLGWLDQLSPQCRNQIAGTLQPSTEEEEVSDFRQFRKALPPIAEAVTASLVAAKDVIWPEGRAPHFLLFSQEDGGWPKLQRFENDHALADRVRQADGKDVVAYAVFGILLPITKGPDRLLLLPDNTAWLIGRSGVMKVDQLTEAVSIQSDGFLGPSELAECLQRDEPDDDDEEKTGAIPDDPDEEETDD